MIKTLILTRNCWGATSFWVSTSVWESLLNTKKLHFFHVLAWALRDSLVHTMKRVLFGNFQAFFFVFNHVNTCARMRLLVEIHNNVVLLFLCNAWRFVFSSKQNLSRIERRMLEQPGFKSLGLQIYNVNFGPIITTSVRNQKSRALLYWGHKICLNNKFYWCCKHWVFSIEYSWVDH